MDSRSNREALSRRQFVQMGAALAALTGTSAVGPIMGAAPVQGPAARARPHNVIFMVSDGMSGGVLSLTERFARDCLGRGTHWESLLGDPRVTWGLFDTASLSSPVTDSAAAASAWGSGSRVFNGAINALPDGTLLTPIAHLARDSGRRVGLVTTATVTHATPAGFASAQPRRGDEAAIAPQYRDMVDVVLGGGVRFFSAALQEQYRNAGYTVVRDRNQMLAAANQARLLGIFSDEHMPFTVDHLNDPALLARVPTLAQMTQVALDILAREGKGFLLQVEGARVDHAAHANDTPAILHDQLAFDDAVKTVLDFVARRDDTLVVITTDHGNSNPGLLGMGTNYNGSGKLFGNLGPMRASYATTIAQIRRAAGRQPITPTHVTDVCKTHLQVDLSAEQSQVVAETLNLTRHPTPLNPQLHGVVGVFGQVMVHHTGVAWMGTTHTSDYAVVSALGPGSERFGGIMPNSRAFDLLTDLMECPHRNPTMTQEEARRFARAVGDVEDLSWLDRMLA